MTLDVEAIYQPQLSVILPVVMASVTGRLLKPNPTRERISASEMSILIFTRVSYK